MSEPSRQRDPVRAGRGASSSAWMLPWLLAGAACGVVAWFAVDIYRAAGSTHEQRAAGVASGQTAADRSPAALSWHDGVMRAAPSVVSVYASNSSARRGSTRRYDTTQGSGVIIDADGLIVTNLHLIDDAEVINVALPDGRLLIGESIGQDAETDLAVVRIPTDGLPALSLERAPSPRVGDVVLAIGNPFGVGQTVTQGIVSAVGRRVAGGSAWQDFIQIDAAINPGNSGGALIDTNGVLVGVNTAVFLGEPAAGPTRSTAAAARGIGFAIPADVLARVVASLVRDGRVARGWLGIGVDDAVMYPELTVARTGALVTDLLEGGSGADAGLRQHDLIVQINGEPVLNARALLLGISALAPGSEVVLGVRRDDQDVELKALLGERPVGG